MREREKTVVMSDLHAKLGKHESESSTVGKASCSRGNTNGLNFLALFRICVYY